MRTLNVIQNHEEIVDYLEKHALSFESREHNSEKHKEFENEFGRSTFNTLFDADFPQELTDLILQNFPIEESCLFEFMQIQKYDVGQYILPHLDSYTFGLRLFQLSTNELNGLTVQEGDKYMFYEDIGGSEIEFDRNAYHWVHPVRGTTRYSLVIGV